MNKKEEILVTGAAGFIGFHTCIKLLRQGKSIIGFDNINSYYDVELKESRLQELKRISKEENLSWQFVRGGLEDNKILEELFENFNFKIVINLAAQAGVRYSKEAPITYINSNIFGFVNLLECCRKFKIKNFIYASSSSVYGENQKIPFKEIDPVDHPISLYAASKRSNELIAHTYSHLYGIPCIGLRFFTVYGPFGRPDMAPMIFAKSIFEKKPIKIFNYGKMSRDFTYIDDVTEIIGRLIYKSPKVDKKNIKINYPSKSSSPFIIFNIGCGNKIKLLEFINILEKEIGIEAIKLLRPLESGDVINTFSDNSAITKYTKYKPQIKIKEGIKKFIFWYKDFYGKL